MLRVLCSESELDEYGVVLTIGEHVSRLAARIEHPHYGTDLDTVEWRFDQYADAVGYPSATISGTVTAISAVYVQLTGDPDGGWTARPGSAHLEPLDTTSATRRIEPVIDWEPPSPPDEDGHSYRVGHAHIEDGDEHLSGWVVTLDPSHLEPGATPA